MSLQNRLRCVTVFCVQIFFPLRSNAYGLVSTNQSAITRRIKLASLIGDVLIEDGVYVAQAGPGGSFEMWSPEGSGDIETLQTPKHRGHMQSGNFRMDIGQDPSGEMMTLIDSPTAIHWQATYLPIKRSLDTPYPWLRFGTIQEDSRIAEFSKIVLSSDKALGALRSEPVDFVRNRILASTSRDTVVSAGLKAVLVTDRRHNQVVQARVAQGHATRVPAAEAVRVLAPDVDVLTWDDIDKLRRHRGWAKLREVWSEVGQMAMEYSENYADMDLTIHRTYLERVTEAAAQAEGPKSRFRTFGKILDLAFGAMLDLSSLSPVVTIGTTTAVAAAKAALEYGDRVDVQWIAAHHALFNRTNERLANETGPDRG